MTVDAVVAPASFGWITLQLHYDGRHPPLALLDDLGRLGWSVPAPPSRPASAIDWYTPDPTTGQRFTVRPWRAVHDIDPPGRHSGRAGWNPAQRAGALQALASVLLGHQVAVTSSVPELAEPAMAPPAGPVAAPRAAPPPAAPPTAPAAAVLSFRAPVERRDQIEAILAAAGVAHHTEVEITRRTQVFRGSRSELALPVLVGEALVPSEGLDALRDRLRDDQAAVEVRPAGPDDRQRLRSRPAPPEPAPVAPMAAVHAVVRVPVATSAVVVVDRIVGHPVLVGLPVAVRPGTRNVAVHFRGSTGETEQPCLYVEVTCPPGMAQLVHAVLVQEAGVGDDEVEVVPAGIPPG